MFKKFIIYSLSVLTLVSLLAQAENEAMKANKVDLINEKSQKIQLATLKAKLGDVLGEVSSVKPTPMVGLVEVIVNNRVFYSSYDGNYILQGKLFDINNQADLTEETLSTIRIDGVQNFSDDMIVFKAKDEKHVISVFTDITCGYCRKMHEQIDEYNDKGITVRYLAYPRYGVKDQLGQYSKGFKDLRSIWCHEDPKMALTKAKAGSTVAQRICDKPIEAEFDFGRQIGVSGTPAIIFENGFLLPGYKDPDSLLQILDSMKAAS